MSNVVTVPSNSQKLFGRFSHGNIPGLRCVTIGDNSTIGGYDFQNLSELVSVSFPSLTTIDSGNIQGGSFQVRGCPVLYSINAPLLTTVGGPYLRFQGNSNLSWIDLRSLTTASGIYIGQPGDNSLASLRLDALTTCPVVQICCLPALTSLSLPNLTSTTSFLANNSGLVSVTLTNWTPVNGSTVDFYGNNLTSASVNQVLARCVANPAYVSGQVLLKGGNNGMATGQGETDTSTLVLRGVIVSVNTLET